MGRLLVLVFATLLGACMCMNTWELPAGNLLDFLDRDLELDWLFYKKSFNKTYESASDELKRRIYWQDNLRFIREHNAKFSAGESTFEVGENHMADMAEDEIKKTYLSGLVVPEEEPDVPLYPADPDADLSDTPLEKDWRTHGYVTPVKNQGTCGSCWTFSAVGALEGMLKKKTGRIEELSEQNLLDCARRGNHGCRGGWMNNAFQYVKENGGINSERCYRYQGRQYYCRYKRNCKAATIRGYYNVRNGEDNLQRAAGDVGPIAIATDANHRSFMFYRRGLYYEPRCNPRTPPSHAMTLVGYGSSRYGSSWIVKNSWGTRWGESGYVSMARNRRNNCRIADFASFAV